MAFIEIVGAGALVCYVVSILFNNVGFGCLAVGLTMYALQGGGI